MVRFIPFILFLFVPPFCYIGYAIGKTIPEVVEVAGKAVVNIKTDELIKEEGAKGSTILRRLIKGDDDDLSEEEVYENIGSGVVMDPRGIIVTNEHLISRAIGIMIRFIDGKEYEATVLGCDPELDIAILKIKEAGGFPYLKAKRDKRIRVGEQAIVIGNPYGLSSTVTAGVVSAVGRNLRIDERVYMNLIQTDASINPGNSGGVMLDSEGNPMGIVTAIFGEGKGIGFAIPIHDVMNMMDEFLEKGIKRPIFGVVIEMKRDIRGAYLYVNRVIPKSPAARNGIEVGDRIVELNKKRIKEGIKIQRLMRGIGHDATIYLKVIRGDRPYLLDISVKEIADYHPSPVDEGICQMRVADIKGYPKIKFKLKEQEGVVVTKVYKGGSGERWGLREGDVILTINNNPISNKKDFDNFMVEGLKRNYILYQVKRAESLLYLPLKIDTLL